MSETPDFSIKLEVLNLIEAKLSRGPSRRAQRFMALGGATALSFFGVLVGLEVSWPLFVGWVLMFTGINRGILAFLRHPLRDKRSQLLHGQSVGSRGGDHGEADDAR